jgi:hypothetical protein
MKTEWKGKLFVGILGQAPSPFPSEKVTYTSGYSFSLEGEGWDEGGYNA